MIEARDLNPLCVLCLPVEDSSLCSHGYGTDEEDLHPCVRKLRGSIAMPFDFHVDVRLTDVKDPNSSYRSRCREVNIAAN